MRWRLIWKHPLFWLGIMVTIFIVISCFSSIVAYDNFRSTSATNEGTIAQAVSSATFGHQVPFYESADCASRDRCSFLIVHTAFVLYLAVPFYAGDPSTVTLLVLQSLVIAAAAVPLYWLTRQVTKSVGKSLFAAGLYLVWAPLFSTFTLHVETLLPVEIIGLAALWQSGRYRWGLFAALIAFLTFEVAPIFVFLVGLFFLVPYGERWARRRWRRWRSNESGESRRAVAWTEWFRSISTNREIRYTLVLVVASVVALAAVVTFRNFWGGSVLGIVQPPVSSGITGLFYGGTSISSAPAGTILSSSGTAWTAQYWLIALGLVGFLPFLSPRSLVIFGPWIFFTFLTSSAHFTTIGDPYTVVDAGPIFIGVAYGLARLPWGFARGSTTSETSFHDAQPRDRLTGRFGARGRSRAIRAGVLVILAGVVGANLLLSPINPVLPGLGYQPGAPFISDYFNHSLEVTPGMEWADNMVSSIPLHATVAVSGTLYPLVGRFPYAFVMTPGLQPYSDTAALSRLPFNLTGGPQFVLMEETFLTSLQPKFSVVLSNPSEYGLRGYVSSTAIGPLLLYEQGTASPAQRYGPAIAELNGTFAPRAGLMTGPQGRLFSNSTAPTGYEIRSASKANSTQDVWTGPDVFLPPGSYAIRFEVSASGPGLTSNPNAPVLGLVGSGFGWTVPLKTVTASEFEPGGWTIVTASVTVESPVPMFSLEGFALNGKVTVAVASVAIVPADGI